MDWKLITKLSLFGLAMAIATVYLISSSIEPICWLLIFLVCAYLIARSRRDKHFLHGFFTSLFNCVWITAVHMMLSGAYLARHPQEAEMMQSMPIPVSPVLMMAMMGPFFGVVSGLVLGLFALVAGKFVKPAQS